MRIIAGEFSSRTIKTLKGTATRPTLDKVREAVFSSLGGFFDGGKMLDLYAGSGAVGIEALSRGMSFAYFVDKNYEAIRIIKENITALNLEDKTKVLSMLDSNSLHYFTENHIKFDLVYLDPPYALQQNEKIIGILDEKGLLTSSARIVVECLKEDTYADRIGDVEKYKEAIYGISKIVYYRKVNE